MTLRWDRIAKGRRLLAAETGTLAKEATFRVALVYPSPYHTAMSSLGYQTIYRQLHDLPDVAADRAMLPQEGLGPDEARSLPLFTLERETLINEYPLIAFSIAYELEITGLFACLTGAGIPLLAAERDESHLLIVAGGPLTFSNPAPLAPFCDVILLGEAEETITELIAVVRDFTTSKRDVLDVLAHRPGFYVPTHHGNHVPPIARANDALLPAYSVIATPHTELSSMFLIEAERGCSRGCTYCVMRRSTNGGMRRVPPEVIFDRIPPWAQRVGLVGAAVTDHPRINEIVHHIVSSGREIGISSLRADRLTDELVGILAQGGYRTLTVASDGASERLRHAIERKTYERHLIHAAELAHKHRLRILKIYMMLGLPDETDDDILELTRFSLELSRIHPHVVLGIAPFVAKRNTPLDGQPYAGIAPIENRIALLKRGLKGRVELRATSARWAWVEYQLAQGGPHAGLAALDAWRNGGTFAAWKQAFGEAIPKLFRGGLSRPPSPSKAHRASPHRALPARIHHLTTITT